MKSATLTVVLVRLTKALALVAAVVVFGFLYVLAIQPQRAAASAARRGLEDAKAHLSRGRASVRVPNLNDASVTEMEPGRPPIGQTADGAESIAALMGSSAVGGVTNLSIQSGTARNGKAADAPLTIRFDARYEQVGRFLRNLRTLPTTFELRSVALTERPGQSVHAEVVLIAVSRNGPPSGENPPRAPYEALPVIRRPRTRAEPPQRDPVVSSILVSGRRRVALIDGRVVAAGDRVGPAVVQSIEPDAVVIVTQKGEVRRLRLERPVVPVQPR